MKFTRSISSSYLSRNLILGVLAGIILGSIILDFPYAAIFIMLGLIVFFLFFRSPLKALSILIILLPFTNTSLFNDPLINLKGAQPFYLLALFVILIAVINYGQSVKMPKYSFLFSILIVTIFGLSIIRSLPNLDLINQRYLMEGKNALSALAYFLKAFVRPLIFFMPFIVIVKFCNKIREVEFLMNILFLSTVALSFYVIYLGLFKTGGNPDVKVMSEALQLDLGMHRNLLANFLILGLPIVLARYFLKKNIVNMLGIIFTVSAFGLSYSRTAYAILIFSFILYLFISKRAKLLPIIIAIAIGSSFIISESIIERASRGIESQDRDEISAGRIDQIWLPLIYEYSQSPRKLLFGNGRFAVVSADAAARGIMADKLHPHNMYLEQVLDAGILGLTVFMSFFLLLFKKILYFQNAITDSKLREYQYAVIISMVAYFTAGLTGRTLFPGGKNCFFWIVVAIAVVIIRLVQESEDNSIRKLNT
jgi:hypothetical protein